MNINTGQIKNIPEYLLIIVSQPIPGFCVNMELTIISFNVPDILDVVLDHGSLSTILSFQISWFITSNAIHMGHFLYIFSSEHF
jgi:hypothetical protein